MRDFLGRAVPVMIPFSAFALGTSLDLSKVWQAGLLGLLLGLAVVVVTGTALLAADRLTGGTGVAGLAAASTAGNAAAVPAYAPAAPAATILVAACVVVTAILVPLVTHWWATRIQSAAVSAGALPGPPDVGSIGDLSGMPTAKEHAAGRGKIGMQADR